MPTYSAAELLRARTHLTAFIQDRAKTTAGEVGFCWRGQLEAPSTYPQLRGAYQCAAESGRPLPVSSDYCDHSIFLAPTDNMGYRFWHDVSHVRRGLSFAVEDELELAQWQLDQAERHGLGPDSLAYRLFEADAIGQVYLTAVGRRFPYRQARFILDCVEQGMARGLLAELRRTS